MKEVQAFLRKYYVPGKPVLLGFSGGPDSLCLLHLLKKYRVDAHVAHVDHGWRPESAAEAEKLREQTLGYPFYLHRVEGGVKSEAAGREARLKFFSTLYHQLGCQALVLGHHADDQAETVLKRIFEGAHLTALGGILPVATFEGMTIWRPLLNVRKAKVAALVSHLKPIDDHTNRDPRFLRARMRTVLLPELSRQFGKEIAAPLYRLGEAAQELSAYFERRIAPYFSQVKRSCTEVRVNLKPLYPFERVELKLFLKKLTAAEGLALSHAALESLTKILEEGAPSRKIISRGKIIEIHCREIALKL